MWNSFNRVHSHPLRLSIASSDVNLLLLQMEDEVYSELVAMLSMDKESFRLAQERFPAYGCFSFPYCSFLREVFHWILSQPFMPRSAKRNARPIPWIDACSERYSAMQVVLSYRLQWDWNDDLKRC